MAAILPWTRTEASDALVASSACARCWAQRTTPQRSVGPSRMARGLPNSVSQWTGRRSSAQRISRSLVAVTAPMRTIDSTLAKGRRCHESESAA